MYTGIRLTNFKCYSDTGFVPLRPLTVLMGVNNAGKSTLIQSLLLLKQTFEDRDVDEVLITAGARTDLGGYRDIVRRGSETQGFSIGVGIQQSMMTREDEAAPKLPDGLDFAFDLDSRANAIRVSRATLRTGNKELLRVERGDSGPEVVGGIPSPIRRHMRPHFTHFLPTLTPPARRPRSERIAALVVDYWVWSQAYEHMWAHVLDSTNHISPLRPSVPRYSVRGQMPASTAWAAGENLLRELRSREKVGFQRRRLLDSVNEWVSGRLEVLRGLRLEPLDNRADVVSLVGDSEFASGINVANMGSGVSQLLPIIAGTIETGRRGTLLVEQPELHLHPRAQADLTDIFIEGVSHRGAESQYIIETHSEHLILRVRRRIAEGKLDPAKVMFLVVEPRRRGHQVIPLEPDARGHFPSWPKGFFETGYEESLAFARAATKTRRPQRSARS